MIGDGKFSGRIGPGQQQRRPDRGSRHGPFSDGSLWRPPALSGARPMIDQPHAPMSIASNHAPPSGTADDPAGRDVTRDVRRVHDSLDGVRASDLEPYTGLRYLSTLF